MDSNERDRRCSGPAIVLIGPRTSAASEDVVMMFAAINARHAHRRGHGWQHGEPLAFDLPGGGSTRVCAKRDTYPDGREFVGKRIKPQETATPAPRGAGGQAISRRGAP